MKPRIVVLLGPTATGKTEAAVTWAREVGGEIISADSMQVYRYLDIGTAKPSPEVRKAVRHHLIDVVSPDENYSAARFVTEADRIIRHLTVEGKPVFVVGGTGLYIRALLGGLFPGPNADMHLRDLLAQQESLYDMLAVADPVAAARIHPRDHVRIIRALEVKLLTGASITEQQQQHGFRAHKYDCLTIGFWDDRPALYDRINRRTREMFTSGLVEEVRDVLAMGYGKELRPLNTLGYRHVIALLEGKIGREEAIELTARDTRHYAKRQETWFRREENILWFKPHEPSARERVMRFWGYS